MGKIYLSPDRSRTADDALHLNDLKDQLRRAVDAENFELAAELRDRIRVLDDH